MLTTYQIKTYRAGYQTIPRTFTGLKNQHEVTVQKPLSDKNFFVKNKRLRT